MPNDRLLKAANLLHRGVAVLSRGSLGWRLAGMPALELTTTGRRSGRPRRVMLTAPLVEAQRIIVVASRGGDDRHPDWFHNLIADPGVLVRLGRGTGTAMTAHIADATERAVLWERITERHPRYARYQERTTREIPVVVLEPAESGNP